MTGRTLEFGLPGWDILEAAQRAGAVIDVEVWRFTIRPPAGAPVPIGCGTAPDDLDGQPADDVDSADVDSAAVDAPPRGRPPLYDWSAIMAEVERIAAAGEMPEKLADLYRHVVSWCQERGWKYIPCERRLYAKLKELHRRALERGGRSGEGAQ